MAEIESNDIPGDGGQSDTEQLDEMSFSYLVEHASVPLLRKKLELLLAGESSETLWRQGSIEQYIRVLLAESKVTLAQYYFSEALFQTIQNWNPLLMEASDRLNNILSLIAAFTPSVGFGKVLTYLNRSEGVKRTDERVLGEIGPVDLYKKGLLALAHYYPTPPFHSNEDLGFKAYLAVLDRNLNDRRYSGYAAVRLHQLGVLDIASNRFKNLLFSSDSVGIEIFRMLLDLADEPNERVSVGKELGKILLACARAGDIAKFKALASFYGATFDPEGDYQVFWPTLTLNDGTVLEIILNMDDVKETALRHYIKYTNEKVHELLAPDDLNNEKIKDYVSGYLAQVTSEGQALNALVKELATLNAQIRTSNNNFVLTVFKGDSPNDVILQLNNNVQIELLKWMSKSQFTTKTKYQFASADS